MVTGLQTIKAHVAIDIAAQYIVKKRILSG